MKYLKTLSLNKKYFFSFRQVKENNMNIKNNTNSPINGPIIKANGNKPIK